MRILWMSNAPWAKTGYGQQTDLFWWRIQKLGHEVYLAANYGLAGAPLKIEHDGEIATVLPAGFNTHGADIIAPYARQTKADIVITLYDTWVFDPGTMAQVKWCPWLPVDHDAVPEAVARALQPAWQPLAYSRFGEQALKDAGFANVLYVPHGIDTQVFKPMDRREARQRVGLPGLSDETFLMTMVAANKGFPARKAFGEVFEAYARFLEKHPKTLLYMHTLPTQEMGGLDMGLMLKRAGIPPNSVIFPDKWMLQQGYPAEFLATLYNAADVLLSPSYGEGFGVPILEAQACGCPVIVGDWTSMPELCFSGWAVKGQKFWTPIGAYQFIPFIDEIERAMGKAYEMRAYDKLRRSAAEGAREYDAGTVTERYWRPALETIAKALEGEDLLEMVDIRGKA